MNAVVVVAGGSGKRMGADIPKQYLELAGKPLIIHTLDRFYEYDPAIRVVLVVATDHLKYWDEIANSYEHGEKIVVAPGGASRYDSVKNGLGFIGSSSIVGIHDAVRPLVSHGTITRCYSAAEKHGSGIPVVDMDESVRKVLAPGKSENLERSTLKRVQTPQVFRSEEIIDAYNRTRDPSFTDDASVYESVFGQVILVEGNQENIKITKPADLELASLILQ